MMSFSIDDDEKMSYQIAGAWISFSSFVMDHYWGVITEVAGIRLAASLRKRLQYSNFPVNIAKFLWAAFFYRTPPAAAFVTTTGKKQDLNMHRI